LADRSTFEYLVNMNPRPGPRPILPSDTGKIVELQVEKLVPGGDGLARHQGRVIFIPATLPGEKVLGRFLESKKDFARAELIEVQVASPMRVEPVCPVAGICGGCDWQHIDYSEQLRQKVALTEDALRRTGGLSFPDLTIESGKPLGYRNRIQIHRDDAGRAGFLAKGSHNIVPVNTCPVAHAGLDSLFQSAPPIPVSPRKNVGLPSGSRFPAWAHSLPNQGGDFLVSGEVESNQPDAIEPGFSVKILDRTLHFDLQCFFQSNLEMLAKLIPFALDGLKGRLAMDLYCGVGLFGAFLQDKFAQIIAVEENPIALDYARRNIGPGHIFLPGKLEDLILVGSTEFSQADPEVIIVDPPRPGLDSVVRDFLIEKGPSQVIYVSCNPVTMARDLKILLAGGFILDDLRLFDFYPQTSHIEAVAKLQKA
jgi:23S rRNA (uracil1939-C5)-methyltransferase